jgi:hypothetical protein
MSTGTAILIVLLCIFIVTQAIKGLILFIQNITVEFFIFYVVFCVLAMILLGAML